MKKFKMFRKILITYSEKLTKKHLDTFSRVTEEMKRKKINFSVLESKCLKEADFENVDLIVTIGGDGTFVRASGFIKDALIFGINSEPEFSEGALTSINENELDFLEKIFQGDYKTISRQRATVRRNGIKLKELALNEVYVGAENQFHTSRYIIKFRGMQEEQRSSGALVVTGSGSNAWFKSAGGKPFSYDDKKLKFLVREVFLGRLFKPMLINGEIFPGEKISFWGKRYDKGIVAIDANSIYPFNKDDRIGVELSKIPLNVVIR